MFCVIQEIETKKANKNGYSKEIISEFSKMSVNGEDLSHWWYYYSHEKFERPVKKAYKISIHHSYRENGKVKKKQFVLCTINYYELATDSFWGLYDCCNSKIQEVAKILNVDADLVYNMAQEKIESLQDKIREEFSQTEEYKTHEEHERITTIYLANKIQFAEKYNVDKTEYDRCYDVFGTLQNPEYLKKIEQEAEFRKKYEEQARSYREKFYDNYTNSSYFNYEFSNHKEENKDIYNQFYKVLAKKFHPDANPDKDTTVEMTVLNQLKAEWGL